MEPKLLNKSTIVLISIFSLIIITFVLLISLFRDSSIIIFCDVGQGDGVYIRTPNHEDIVIDAGPDGKIAECLSRYMPFYDRTIEWAFLSHPQQDHYGGYLMLNKHYKINTFVTNLIYNGETFTRLLTTLRKNNTTITSFFQGDTLTKNGYIISFLWPSREYFFSHTYVQDGKRTTQSDLNAFSQVFIFSSNRMSILFTGDIDPETSFHISGIYPVSILKVPHHGSKNGLTASLLALAHPKLAVISVGKRNSFGHPSRIITDLLLSFGIPYKRTDQEGDIVIKNVKK
jgi:competence protein ComEC